MYDILIKNGIVIDGSGEAMEQKDIAIKEDRIVRIGQLHDEKGELEIDAEGLLVCPGFIDVNNHSDTHWQIFNDPDLESLVYQGITTIVGGNCGSSLAPLASPETIVSVQKWIDIEHTNFDWLNLKEFLEVVGKKGISVNFATLVGHSTLRRGIIKDEVRSPSVEELEYLRRLLKNSLKEGALGMSSGLIYTHAKLASTEELIGLAEVIREYGGVYVTHIRDERNGFLEGVEEAVKISKYSKVKLHISHLKVMGSQNWRFMDDAFNLIEGVDKSGTDITFDVFPYTVTGTVLYTLLPDWVSQGGKSLMIHRLKDPGLRAKAVAEMRETSFDYDKIEIAASSMDKTLARRKISEIAKSQDKSVEDAIVDILIASGGRVITTMEVLDEDNVRRAIAHPLSMIASNGSGHNTNHAKSGEIIHPRNFGAFPRVFDKYVRKEKILDWEGAVRKMTTLPAQKFGIEKRGRLKEGCFADIAIFDRDKIRDLATQENPYRYSQGMEFVIVNGQIVLSEGKYTGKRNGQIIKR